MTKGPVPINEGDVIAGKYLVGRVLGQGGMGIVVAASHLQLEQRVALKFLLPGAVENQEVVLRFAREARAAAKIQSEHVARVLDVGQVDAGTPYMVMEYLEGEDLESMLARRGPLPIAEAVECLLQSCEAIAEAHSLGIVHRDLKPPNLFLAKRAGGKPIVKVLDFGISKVAESTPTKPGLTQTLATLGSPPYMSPEQVKSPRSVDARSDIWSLGAILYELVTGQRPFERGSVPETLAAILYQDPRPPSEHRADVPVELDRAVMRSLDKNLDSRFQNVSEFAAAIGSLGGAGSARSLERIANLLGAAATGDVRADDEAPPHVEETPASSPPASSLIAASIANVEGQVELARQPEDAPPSAPARVATLAFNDGKAVAGTAFLPPLGQPMAIRPASPAGAAMAGGSPPRMRAPVRGNDDRRPGALSLVMVASLALGGGGAAYWVVARRAPSAHVPTAAAPAVTNSPVTRGAAEAAAPEAPTGLAILPTTTTTAPSPASRADARSVRGRRAGPLTAAPAVGGPVTRTSSHPVSVAAPALCAGLLERQSLGETLTANEQEILRAQQCGKARVR